MNQLIKQKFQYSKKTRTRKNEWRNSAIVIACIPLSIAFLIQGIALYINTPMIIYPIICVALSIIMITLSIKINRKNE